MDLFSIVTFDELVAALVTCIVIREIMVLVLPDRIAGPGGWLIDTGLED